MRRRYQRLLLLVVVLPAAVLALGSTTQPKTLADDILRADTVIASKFAVESEEGVRVARLDDGIREGSLMLMDEDGTMRVAINAHSPSVQLWDEHETNRVHLSVGSIATGLDIKDEDGVNRASLNVSVGGASLSLFDEQGMRRADLGGRWTKYADGTVFSYPESSIHLFRPDGQLIWSAPR